MKFKLSIILFFVATIMFAQKSPRKQSTGEVAGAKIEVDYGAPSVRGRVIFGDLVKFDNVWRAGANENTTMSFSKDVKINGKSLPAGKYGFFMIPRKSGDWDLIFSKKNDAWGSNGYTEDNDQVRVQVTAKNTDTSVEMMRFVVTESGIQFAWDKTSWMISVN